MVKSHSQIVFFLCMVLSLHPLSATKVYNILKFGAKPNGIQDTTQAFLNVWKASCNTVGPVVIEVPKGRYLLRPLTLQGQNCKNSNTKIQIKGTLIAPLDYNILGKVENWLAFEEVSGVSIVGGFLDAKGVPWWSCKTSGGNCSDGATSLRFINSYNIVISGLTSLNSQMFHIGINGCQNVHIQGVDTIASDSSPNTDGIHVESSTHVKIMNSTMRTGDDCISVGPGTKNLWIENVLCGPGHGISIGSLGKDKKEQGVQNVTVKGVKLSNTANGLRIKAWSKPSTGFVRGVLYQDITMRNVQNPIIIDQHYCPNNNGCPHQVSGVKISNVTYKGIHGTSATEYSMIFACSSLYPCTGIKLENINITSLNQVAKSTCSYVKGQALGMVQPKSCF